MNFKSNLKSVFSTTVFASLLVVTTSSFGGDMFDRPENAAEAQRDSSDSRYRALERDEAHREQLRLQALERDQQHVAAVRRQAEQELSGVRNRIAHLPARVQIQELGMFIDRHRGLSPGEDKTHPVAVAKRMSGRLKNGAGKLPVVTAITTGAAALSATMATGVMTESQASELGHSKASGLQRTGSVGLFDDTAYRPIKGFRDVSNDSAAKKQGGRR